MERNTKSNFAYVNSIMYLGSTDNWRAVCWI